MATAFQAILDQEDVCRDILEKGLTAMRRDKDKLTFFDEEKFLEDLTEAIEELNELNRTWWWEQGDEGLAERIATGQAKKGEADEG